MTDPAGLPTDDAAQPANADHDSLHADRRRRRCRHRHPVGRVGRGRARRRGEPWPPFAAQRLRESTACRTIGLSNMAQRWRSPALLPHSRSDKVVIRKASAALWWVLPEISGASSSKPWSPRERSRWSASAAAPTQTASSRSAPTTWWTPPRPEGADRTPLTARTPEKSGASRTASRKPSSPCATSGREDLTPCNFALRFVYYIV